MEMDQGRRRKTQEAAFDKSNIRCLCCFSIVWLIMTTPNRKKCTVRSLLLLLEVCAMMFPFGNQVRFLHLMH